MWIDKRLIQSNDELFRLVEDSAELPLELTQALSTFLVPQKGLHIAIVCSGRLPEDDRQKLRETLGEYTEISEADINGEKPSLGEWRDGRFVYYCCKNASQDILGVIVSVMECLGRDIQQKEFIASCIEDSSGDPQDLWVKLLAKKIAKVLTEDDVSDGCADIKIVAIMPREAFDVFSDSALFFPSFIEFVLREASSTDPIPVSPFASLAEQLGLTEDDLFKLDEGKEKIVNRLRDDYLEKEHKSDFVYISETERVIEEIVSISAMIKVVGSEEFIEKFCQFFKKQIQLTLDNAPTAPRYYVESDRGGAGKMKIFLPREKKYGSGEKHEDFDAPRQSYVGREDDER